MITCPNCNKKLEDGTKFCDNCGAQLPETIFCPNCGTQSSTEFAFCQSCGAALTEQPAVPEQPEKKKFALPTLPFQISKKILALASAALALVLVVAIVLSVILTGTKKNAFAMYLKDDELYFTSTTKISPMQVTKKLFDGDIDESDLRWIGQYGVAYSCCLSEDGKIIFFPDKFDPNSEDDSKTFSLFYRYVSKPEEDPVKIDSDIQYYHVSKSGKLVTYLKGEEGDLYQHDLTDKTKLSSEVSDFYATEDGKKVWYLDQDENLYLKKAGKDKVKFDGGVSTVDYINEEGDTVYYRKNDSLYKRVEGKDKQKIASDVDSVLAVYESGEVYYQKTADDELTLMDYIEDDKKIVDDAMTEPIAPEMPSYWDYDDYDDYEAAYTRYETQYEQYRQARDLWYEKLSRDSLREELDGEVLSTSFQSLCYYNGKEEKVLNKSCVSYREVSWDAPVIIYSVFDAAEIDKVKLSEIESSSEVEDMVEEAISSSAELYLAVKDNCSAVDQTDAERFIIDTAAKNVYFLDDVSEEDSHGDLYQISISGNKAQKPVVYDRDVYSYSVGFIDDQPIYYKDVKDDQGELYISKKKIDYDVRLYYTFALSDGNTIVYLTDWDEEDGNGTLKIFKKGKAVKVTDDVYDFIVMPNDDLLYLSDYSTKHYNGELFLCKNGKSEKIDDDVSVILPVNDSQYYRWVY